jgi:hypothetical protein
MTRLKGSETLDPVLFPLQKSSEEADVIWEMTKGGLVQIMIRRFAVSAISRRHVFWHSISERTDGWKDWQS